MYIHAALISNKVSVIRSRWGTVKRHGKVADTNYEFGGQEFESLRARHSSRYAIGIFLIAPKSPQTKLSV